jgi:intracellular multiplication protein IcmB
MIISFLDELFASFLLMMRQPVESFIQLETADDSQTLVSGDGSLLTYLRVSGSRQMIGGEEYKWIVEQATLKLGARFDRPGHAMQFYFLRDPDRVGKSIEKLMVPNRNSAQSIGLELEDLLHERRKNLERYLAHEEIYIVLWTRPSGLTKSEFKRAQDQRKKINWPKAKNAQFPFAALDPLRLKHKAFVTNIAESLFELGIVANIMDVHDALRAARASIYPNLANDKWKACLPGDPIAPRKTRYTKDWSDILWPSIASQMATMDAEVLGPNVVRIGDLAWAATDMTLGPADGAPFTQLLNRLIEADMPFRISFLIESGGAAGESFRKLATALLGWTNRINKQIKDTLVQLMELAQSDPVVKLRVSFATYGPWEDKRLIENRLANLMAAVESWGYCQVSTLCGDPLEAVMSSALGISCSSTAVAGVAPLYEVVKLLPWQRASSPFTEGSVILRTPDGRIWPYQSGTPLTTTWFDLIFAQPGSGKSVLMNALNLGSILSAGMSKLPYIAVLDIGPSSAGLISLIRDALPAERRNEVVYFRLLMTPDFAVNPFDSQLGCRYPLPDERAYLSELLTLICTPPGQDQPYDGMTQLVGYCVDEMFRWRDDAEANAEPRPYLELVEPRVDDAIRRLNLTMPPEPYWWEVVDTLFDAGAKFEAMLAQRHAVPTLVDAITAARRPQIRAFLEETAIGPSAEGVIHAFERMIASAIREFPILAGITKFDIGDARIAAVDLQEVSPQGDAAADRQTAIMYMLARHVLIRSWWLNPDSLRNVPPRYRPHHDERIKEIREIPKRLCYDEFHRTANSKAVRAQLIRDVREGRKWGVQIVLASQLLNDFTVDMVDLATGIWICGSTASERAIADAGDKFSLTDTARWVMRYRLTGPKPSGAPVMLILSTTEGRYEQHLVNTLGPVELWALSTSFEDVVIRNRLYEMVGAVKARRLLATVYPGGTARYEVRRRIVIRTEKGEMTSNATQAVLQEIVDELAAYVTQEVRDALLGIERQKSREAEGAEAAASGQKKDTTGTTGRSSGMI